MYTDAKKAYTKKRDTFDIALLDVFSVQLYFWVKESTYFNVE